MNTNLIPPRIRPAEFNSPVNNNKKHSRATNLFTPFAMIQMNPTLSRNNNKCLSPTRTMTTTDLIPTEQGDQAVTTKFEFKSGTEFGTTQRAQLKLQSGSGSVTKKYFLKSNNKRYGMSSAVKEAKRQTCSPDGAASHSASLKKENEQYMRNEAHLKSRFDFPPPPPPPIRTVPARVINSSTKDKVGTSSNKRRSYKRRHSVTRFSMTKIPLVKDEPPLKVRRIFPEAA